ncbi:hypothetical protein ACFO0N_14270 [Halobium salinum]|uniref:Integral membrane protein n=1 Tax=Halobium salinum TaxID=1364940 RepID=A0ABD5PEN7_9EURY|nr:hypothetical protein [Halobium salinum]
MVEFVYVVSALLMGLALLAVAGATTRVRHWRGAPVVAGVGRARPSIGGGSTSAMPTVGPYLAPLVLVGAVAAAVVVVGGPEALGEAPVWAFGLALASVVGLFAVWGAYFAVRNRGRSSAAAVAAGVWTLGLLLVVAITVKLLVAG